MYQNISIYLIIYLYISNTWKPKFCSRDKTLVFQYIVNIFFIFSLSLGSKIMLNLCYVIYTWLMEGSFCIDLSSIRNNGRPLGHVPTSYVELRYILLNFLYQKKIGRFFQITPKTCAIFLTSSSRIYLMYSRTIKHLWCFAQFFTICTT